MPFWGVRGYGAYESRKRQSELNSREKEVRAGAVSELLTPVLSERSKRWWKQEEEIPEKFFVKRLMTVKAAEERFSIEKISYKILTKPS